MALAREMLQEAMDGFFLAAEHGRSDVIKALVDHGQGRIRLDDIVDPETGRTPLHVAVANGKTDAVRVLLAAGFAPDHESLVASDAYEFQDQDAAAVLPPPERDPDVAAAVVVPGRRTPYALAQKLQAMDLVFVFHQFIIQQIAVNDVARVQRLLVAGIPVTMTDGIAQNTLLHWAVSCKANEVLAYLLELQQVQEHALVNQCNADGATPLHLACRANQVDCVQILLKHHADASIVGQKGYCKDKKAVDLSTSTAVMALFDTPVAPLPEELEEEEEHTAAGPKRKSSSAPTSVRGNQSAESEVGDSSIRRRRSATTDHEQQIRRFLLQLEEKDLLINQLKKTIETLVVESQEIHKLGEEGCVLDYVRKLRQEKAILQRHLEDADDHNKAQQQQIQDLKAQIREMSAQKLYVGSQLETLTVASSTDGQDEDEHDDKEDEVERPPVYPLQVNDARVQRHPVFGSQSGDSWSATSVLSGLWPFKTSGTNHEEMDGEIVMTV